MPKVVLIPQAQQANRTKNSVIKGVTLCVGYLLSLMRTDGEITYYSEPQMSFTSATIS